MDIKRIGSYCVSNAAGQLLNQSQPEANADHWLSTFEAVKACYLSRWEEVIHSIYIRGSVAKGVALDHVSDVDSFAVLQQGHDAAIKQLDDSSYEAWLIQQERDFIVRFPFAAGLELDLVAYESIVDREHIYGFTLKVESICIYGENLAEQLPAFQANHEIAFQTRYFHKHLQEFLSEFAAEPEAEKPAFVTWLMRRFLRLGMELVMVQEQRYTRDLYLCYASFAKHYPGQAAQMYHALELAINPEINDSMHDFVNDFGNWLLAEAAENLRRWGYQQNEAGSWRRGSVAD